MHDRFCKAPRTVRRRLSLVLVLALIAGLGLALGAARPVHASGADRAYNYDYWGNQLAAPQAFTPGQVLRGEDLGIGSFLRPSDVFVDRHDTIYLLDSGRNRVVILEPDMSLRRVIDAFDNGGQADGFNAPEGLFVDHEGEIYVADTENGRIVQLGPEGQFRRAFGRPESNLIPSNFVYKPSKLVLDSARRLYVIAHNVNQGIIELDLDGGFTAFIGAIPVQPNPWDYIWKRLSTAAQRAAMASFVPTEYNNIAIDEQGFLYVTSGTLSEYQEIPVRRLNLTGTDIMRRREGFPVAGDLHYLYTGAGPRGPSIFVDVAVNPESSTYACLDRKRGRIFSYDEDGNLLYIYGNLSEQDGQFMSPTAIERFGRGLLVTDAQLNTLTRLDVTTYADQIQSALIAHGSGRYEDAAALWREVLRQNSNSELAYYGLGRTQMRTDDFAGAMTSFRLANHRRAYSDAFQLWLKDVVREYLVWIVLGVVALIAALWAIARYKRLVLRPSVPVLDGLNYAFYLIFHPFDGFYDLKHERRGNAGSATVLYVLLALGAIMQRQLTGFIFNTNNPLRLNVLSVVLSTLLPYATWIVANWCLTTLMDGKGTMLEIYTATGYALTPLVITQFALIPLSHILTIEQGSFYAFFITVATVWSYALIFIGMLVTHDYGLGKNVAVTLFTFVGMGLLLFIGMLVFDLSGQMVNFVRAIAREIQFRL